MPLTSRFYISAYSCFPNGVKTFGKMPTCGTCLKNVSTRSVAIECADCSKTFHGSCVKLSKDDVDNIESEGQVWRCEPCADVRRSSLNLELKSVEGSLTVNELKAALDKLTQQQAELVKDLNTASDSRTAEMAELKGLLSQANEKMEGLITTIEKVDQENTKLRGEIKILKQRLDESEQYSRTNDIEIDGMPEAKLEDVLQVVKDIGRGLDVNITDDMVDVCHRLRKVPGRDGPRGIYVRFVRRMDKEKVLKARRVKRDFSSRHIPGRTDDSRIWIKDALTPARRRLFRSAREAAKGSTSPSFGPGMDGSSSGKMKIHQSSLFVMKRTYIS